MNYIKLSEVVDEVKIFYNSYFESGFDLDETVFYPAVRLLIKKCSKVIHPINTDVVEIKNYKGCTPDDFYMLRKAYGTVTKEEYIPADENQPIVVTEFHTDYKINHCETKACYSECNEYINVIQTMHDGTLVKYPHVFPVSVSSRTQKIRNPLFTAQNPDNIDINGNEIIASFCEGSVVMEYYGLLQEDGEVIIPDNEIIIEAFKEKIKEIILEYLLANTTIAVGQLYQMQVAKSRDAVRNMINMIKTEEFTNMGDISLKNKNLYNRINSGY